MKLSRTSSYQMLFSLQTNAEMAKTGQHNSQNTGDQKHYYSAISYPRTEFLLWPTQGRWRGSLKPSPWKSLNLVVGSLWFMHILGCLPHSIIYFKESHLDREFPNTSMQISCISNYLENTLKFLGSDPALQNQTLWVRVRNLYFLTGLGWLWWAARSKNH